MPQPIIAYWQLNSEVGMSAYFKTEMEIKLMSEWWRSQ
jgi:hypothetical protein